MFPILFNPPLADLSIIACKKILRNTGNVCRKFHLIVTCLMQPGPGADFSTRGFQRLKEASRRTNKLPVKLCTLEIDLHSAELMFNRTISFYSFLVSYNLQIWRVAYIVK